MLRARYAMSGTEAGYAASRTMTSALTRAACTTTVPAYALPTRCCYAMSGTDLPYAATRCPVLT
eukprot:2303082-Rhodomonas_salina.2